MVDPTGWRTEVGGSGLAFTDPTSRTPSVGPIEFDSNNVRQTNGNQSLEADPADGTVVLIDERSDGVTTDSMRMEFCSMLNVDTDDPGTSAGVVFAYQDSNNYLVLEVEAENTLTPALLEVGGGSVSLINRGGGPKFPTDRWLFTRVDVESIGADDLKVTTLHATLSDYRANGDSALISGTDYNWSSPPRRQLAPMGVSYFIYSSGNKYITWLDGIQFYW